ncbi:MAG TPA: N-acetyltransferase family protein [Syntrophomonadaceae bacterium]|nr:N-acetyltransferase family protein [Syntrophomonadaceae bacterium]HQA07972.1 N-acetyltransferase family protein [Syntrophomonadaceae bacterium]HQE23187.1 N-acetyltransferase family protein [Syntrophomonadaceae bacterium]
MNITFQAVKPEHLPYIYDIYTYYVLNSTATFQIIPPNKEEMAQMVFFDNPRYQTFAILDDEVVCGYVLLTHFNKREAYNRTAEVTIYLHPDYVGQGIGSQGLQHIEEFARTRDIHVLVAIICGENQPSIKLFSRQGYSQCACYRQVGEKFGRLLDMVAFQKILD